MGTVYEAVDREQQARKPGLQVGWRWLIWATYLAAWTAALLVPNPAKRIVGYAVLIFLFSKAVHVSAYALWTVLSAWLGAPRRRRWLLLLVMSLHAFGSEYFQSRLRTGRTGSLWDVGLDHLGIALGLLLSWKWWFTASEQDRQME